MTSPWRSELGFSFFSVLLIVATLSVFTSSLFLAIAPSERVRQADSTFQKFNLIQQALRKYKRDHSGSAPATLSDLVTPTGPACAADTNPVSPTYRSLGGWCGPYVDRVVAQDPNEFQTDGWGTIFSYNGTQIRSCGPDRTCGNGDDLTFTDF